ncbi:MAG TPA: CHAT domain-containing tetratricopeptide repeat protein [Pyrinomonadaceae bacterium]|nr:CHAT domain-containing tetratricopeptide repeat protein [Pyrinomonadaceae bacterium]
MLEASKPAEGELSGGHKQRYRLALREGQYAVVTVEQRGVDVVARLFGAGGQLIAAVDSQRTAHGSERIELVAAASGDYVIEVEPSLPNAVAGRCLVQLSEPREATPGEILLHEARRQHYESLRLSEAGKTDGALPLAAQALETRQKVLGPVHAEVAASLLALGTLYSAKGDAVRADSFLRRAAEVTAKTSGAESLDYADVLHALARLRFARGDSAQAERLNRQALAVREKAAGPDSLAAAASLLNLAALYRAASELPEAEKSLQRVLAIRERLLGEEHIEVSHALNSLGLLYYGAGDYDGAEPMLRRSLAIREKVLGPNHTQVGAALNNLGLMEWKRGNYDKAEGYYRRALGIFEKADGPESYGVANSLHNLGVVYKEGRGDYAKAEEHYQRALTILEKVNGENHENTANCLASLGIVRQAVGDYDGAERYYVRALAFFEKAYGPHNPGTIRNLRSLARLYAARGDARRAVELQRRISESEERITRLNLTLGSEKQKLAYFAQLQRPDRVISLHVGLAPDDGAARDTAAAVVLQRKGRVLDALSGGLSALRQRFDSQDQMLLESLGDVTSRLTRLTLSKPQTASPEEHQGQIKALEQEREKLEAEVGRRSAGFYVTSPPVSLDSVRAAVPPQAALVEFAVYQPYDWKAAEEKSAYGEPRYVAYVIRNRGEVRWAELGAAAEIDKAVNALRQALRDPSRGDVRRLARAVDEKLMRPVRALAGDAGRLLVSPDGALNLIPFEALVDERGGYLVERYSLTYLSSGRDLLRTRAAREGGGRPVVVADPAFGDPPVVADAGRAGRGAGARLDYSQVFFGPLPGVGDEVRALRGLLPEAEFLTGARATKAALKRVRGPSILHVATHGFFLHNDSRPAEREPARAKDATRLGKWVVQVDNPLLRAGLALAGANRGPAGDDNGVLTALEMAQLDLRGTKLVVLSACDTGVGEVRSGDGVYGLRRALALAGAESQLMSLWPVSDRSTRDLMIGYYEGLTHDLGRGEALRRVQLRMLRGATRNHPYYWASFIQTGEWADLRGERR